MCHIFRTVRPKNFKVDVRMEDVIIIIIKIIIKQVRQQDAYLAIRPAYPRGRCPRAAKGDKTYLQPVFLHR